MLSLGFAVGVTVSVGTDVSVGFGLSLGFTVGVSIGTGVSLGFTVGVSVGSIVGTGVSVGAGVTFGIIMILSGLIASHRVQWIDFCPSSSSEASLSIT